MQSFRLLLTTIALFVCLYTVTAAPQYGLARRQDDSKPTATASTATASSRSSSASHPRESSTAPSVSDPQSTTEESAPRSTVSATSNTVLASPSATAASSAAANGTEAGTVSDGPLPLHPKTTPALGLIGALFLISGALYAVVGIKNKWIYVFGAAAYLAALSVTVLIIYLMNPPVSNAIQGAFFVAAFFTGALFGALALIFSDLTEGLGCLLGGFCLSMWFLSLIEGGLITSTGGRAIFIGCISAAGYCLSFSHYTRTYGLIGSISFSGATITMLGVDCFSRAGWKEFWLYLWNLNPDVFPLNTNTYAITKGLKAELAGVVILTVFGVISQLRLWKLIKERRNKREEHEQKVAESQRKQETELGRKVEDEFQKERREWEATYGEKAVPGSSDESGLTTPHSASLYEKEDSASTYGSKADLIRSVNKQAIVTVATLPEHEIQQIDAMGTPLNQDGVVTPSTDISRANSARLSSKAVAASRISRPVSATSSLKPSFPLPPVVVPLPFRVPQEEDTKSQISNNASISALPDVEEDVSVAAPHSLVRCLSGKPTMKRLSTARSSVGGFQAEDVVIMSQREDNRASSVAATLDEEDKIALQERSPPHSPVDELEDPVAEEWKEDNSTTDANAQTSENDQVRDDSAVALEGTATTTPSTPTIDGKSAETLKDESMAQVPIPSPTQKGPRQSLTVSTDPKQDDARSKRDFAQSPRLRHDTLVKESSDKSQQSNSAKSDAPSSSPHDDKAGFAVGDLSNALPTRLSKVAQSYRTNEWAKHLESAEKPQVEEIPEPSSPGAQLDHERPAPVSEGIAQPFAVAKRASKRISSNNSNVHRNDAFTQINSNSARQSQGELPALSREASQIRDKGVRVSGSHQPSRIDFGGRRISSDLAQLPSQTLMGKRESLIRNRVTSQNFNQQVSANTLPTAADEDMNLAQRRRVLKHQKPPSASQKWQKSSWAAAPQVVQVSDFDSHQPKRTVGSGSDEKREELLAGWRGSKQQNGALGQNAAAREEQQRAAMMNAKRQKEMEQQQQAIITQQRESLRHNMMRSSDMRDAHREAMRRMQASANKPA